MKWKQQISSLLMLHDWRVRSTPCRAVGNIKRIIPRFIHVSVKTRRPSHSVGSLTLTEKPVKLQPTLQIFCLAVGILIL
jgi:hypothetical protein